MGIFKKIAGIIGPSSRPDDTSYWINARCSRCGEIIRARVDLRNDLSIDYTEGTDKSTYFTRKVLIGASGRCFQRIEVGLTFDANKSLISREISGGSFLEDQTA